MVMSELIFLVFLIAIVWLVISVPAFIAKSRNVSEEHLRIVRVLAILGLFFGVTWVIAIVLALIYPAVAKERPVAYVAPPTRGASAVQPLAYASSHSVSAIEPPAALADEARVPVALETCGNCGRAIGKLEQCMVWDDHLVCAACHKLLSAQVAS